MSSLLAHSVWPTTLASCWSGQTSHGEVPECRAHPYFRYFLAYPACLKDNTRFSLWEVTSVVESASVTTPSGSATLALDTVQWLSKVRILFDVSSRAFKPEPKVTSSVVELVPRSEPLAPAKSDFLQLITKVAFGQRRKMMRTSLKALHPDTICLLKMAGISPTSRPERISVQEFCSIARVLDSWSQRNCG